MIRQGELINDSSFCVLVCDIDDIIYNLQEHGLSNLEATKTATDLLNSDRFRSKFTDGVMDSFNDTIEALTEEEVN